MPSFSTSKRTSGPARHAGLVVSVVGLVLSGVLPARATLGQAYGSVVSDSAQMSARMASTQSANYTVHTLTLAGKAVVREYVGTDGVVFAVAWRGPGRPDLRQLLGDSFTTLQADNTQVAGPRRRRPMSVQRSDLVVRSGGHPGGFWGVAYLPQELPTGVSPQDVN